MSANNPSVVLLFDDELQVVSVLHFGRTSEETGRLREVVDKMLQGCRCDGECKESQDNAKRD